MIYWESNFILEKMLWRYEKGWYDKSRVARELYSQIDELASLSNKTGAKRGILRGFCQQELIRLDDILGDSSRNVLIADFGKAIEQIKEGKKIIQELMKALMVIEQYYFIENSINELKRLIGTDLFDDTPTIKIIFKLQEKTKEYLLRKETQKANLNILVCKEEMSFLNKICLDIFKSQKLKQKVRQLFESLENLQSVNCLGSNSERYFSKITKIKELIESEYLTLAERLLEELENQISDKKLFYSELKQNAENLKESKSENLEPFQITAGKKEVNYWDIKALNLLERRLTMNLFRLREVDEIINKHFKIKDKEKKNG